TKIHNRFHFAARLRPAHRSFISPRTFSSGRRVVRTNMLQRISRALAAAALMLGIATATTLADSPSPMLHYDTSLTELYGSIAPYSGTLDLRIDANGIVAGYYHPETLPSFVLVTGGRTGNKIWLDIGTSGQMHVTGEINNGVISGSAISSDAEGTFYRFNATPSKK